MNELKKSLDSVRNSINYLTDVAKEHGVVFVMFTKDDNEINVVPIDCKVVHNLSDLDFIDKSKIDPVLDKITVAFVPKGGKFNG